MQCVKCGGRTLVWDTRPSLDGPIHRRRECVYCGHRFKTIETAAYCQNKPGQAGHSHEESSHEKKQA